MKNYILDFLLLFSVSSVLTSCLSTTSYKSATVDEGNVYVGQAVGFTTIKYTDESIYDVSKIKKSRIWPSTEFFLQYVLLILFNTGYGKKK